MWCDIELIVCGFCACSVGSDDDANTERGRTSHGIFLAKCHDLNTIRCIASSNLQPEIGVALVSVHVDGWCVSVVTTTRSL